MHLNLKSQETLHRLNTRKHKFSIVVIALFQFYEYFQYPRARLFSFLSLNVKSANFITLAFKIYFINNAAVCY